MKQSILPADTFIVINKTILNEQDRKLLIMLYQPIIGSEAISLYFSLWTYLDKSEIISCEWTHHHLIASMKLNLIQLLESRNRLEAIGLLKTYLKKDNINQYIYELYSPLSAFEFLQSPILGTTLQNNVGKVEYEKIVEYFKLPKIKKDNYEEITCSFKEIFDSSPMDYYDHIIDDIKKTNVNHINVENIDINVVLNLIPDEMLNKNSITKEMIELINKLAFLYNFDEEHINQMIRNSINEKKQIDKAKLRDNCKRYYQFENNGHTPTLIYKNQPEYLRKNLEGSDKKSKLIYQFETVSPYYFLASKNGGSKPSKTDINILENLLVDMELNPGVVNVLVDYVLKINDNKLNHSFIEAIATQWKRYNIKTVEDAMALAGKEYKKKSQFTTKKKQTKKLEEKPEWFDKNIEKEKATAEEIAEMDAILSQYK